MEFKGIRGEWKACFNWSDKNIEIGTSEHEKIALVSKSFDFPESWANAQLIKSSPKMLEMLKRCELWIESASEEANILKDIRELIKEATTI